MKHKTIRTDKASLLVVEMPEGAKFIRIETNQAVVPYGQEVNYEVPATKESYGYEETEGFALPEGNWQLIGRIPDITEEQAKLIVPEYHIERLYATESIYDLLQANEVYFENKETNPQKYNEALESEGIINGWEKKRYNELRQNLAKIPTFKQQMKIWHEAQSKVWDKERCYLFIKVD